MKEAILSELSFEEKRRVNTLCQISAYNQAVRYPQMLEGMTSMEALDRAQAYINELRMEIEGKDSIISADVLDEYEAETRNNLAKIFFDKYKKTWGYRHLDKACDCLDQLVRGNEGPRNSETINMNLGNLYLEADLHADVRNPGAHSADLAAHRFTKVIKELKKVDQDVRQLAHLKRAYALLEQAKHAGGRVRYEHHRTPLANEAIEDLNHLPRDSEVKVLLASAHLIKGDIDIALGMYKEVLASNYDFIARIHAKNNIACILHSQAKPKEATSYIEDAIRDYENLLKYARKNEWDTRQIWLIKKSLEQAKFNFYHIVPEIHDSMEVLRDIDSREIASRFLNTEKRVYLEWKQGGHFSWVFNKEYCMGYINTFGKSILFNDVVGLGKESTAQVLWSVGVDQGAIYRRFEYCDMSKPWDKEAEFERSVRILNKLSDRVEAINLINSTLSKRLSKIYKIGRRSKFQKEFAKLEKEAKRLKKKLLGENHASNN